MTAARPHPLPGELVNLALGFTVAVALLWLVRAVSALLLGGAVVAGRLRCGPIESLVLPFSLILTLVWLYHTIGVLRRRGARVSRTPVQAVLACALPPHNLYLSYLVFRDIVTTIDRDRPTVHNRPAVGTGIKPLAVTWGMAEGGGLLVLGAETVFDLTPAAAPLAVVGHGLVFLATLRLLALVRTIEDHLQGARV